MLNTKTKWFVLFLAVGAMLSLGSLIVSMRVIQMEAEADAYTRVLGYMSSSEVYVQAAEESVVTVVAQTKHINDRGILLQQILNGTDSICFEYTIQADEAVLGDELLRTKNLQAGVLFVNGKRVPSIAEAMASDNYGGAAMIRCLDAAKTPFESIEFVMIGSAETPDHAVTFTFQ